MSSMNLLNAHRMKQIAAILRLEIKKSFFSKRGFWIYL